MKKILLIENDRIFCNAVKQLLETDGYKVFVAYSPQEALTILRNNRIHLAIIDIRLHDDEDYSDNSGLELAQTIDPVIPKVMLSAYPSLNAVRQALRQSLDGNPLALDFVSKADNPEVLLSRVKEIFINLVRINFDLIFEWAHGLQGQWLLKYVESELLSYPEDLLMEEIYELFQILFSDATKILIAPLDPLTNKIPLIKVLPYSSVGLGEPVIVKVGERNRIQVELENYDRYIKPSQNVLAKPVVVSHLVTQRLGAIVYASSGFPLEDAGSLYLYAVQIEWSNTAASLRAEHRRSSEQGIWNIANLISQRISSSPPSSLQNYEEFLFCNLNTSNIFPEMGLLNTLPLIFSHESLLTPRHIDQVRNLLERYLTPSRIALLISFDDPQILDQTRAIIQEKVHRPFAYDIITVGRDQIESIIAAENPNISLRRLVLSQIDLVTVSPFVITGSTPDEMFFGRETELREITSQVSAISYAIIGGRRIGKTSILKRLKLRLPDTGFHALYHDCSYTPTQSELVQALSTDRSWFSEPNVITLTSFAGVLRNLPDNKPLIILLDETDNLIDSDKRSGYPLFNTLRAYANSGRCHFVLSGEQALRIELTNPNSPLYNFANEMLIGRLDFRAVEELITRPMKQLEILLFDEVAIVQRIWDFTSGHPNVVQRLCQRLIIRLNEHRSRSLTLDDVESVVADPDFQRKDFLNVYWEKATSLERLCSLIVLKGDLETLKEVYKALTKCNLDVTLNQVDDALERLVDLRNILQRTTQGYEFAVTAYPEVIAKTARLDDLIALNCETYQLYGDVEPHSRRGMQ